MFYCVVLLKGILGNVASKLIAVKSVTILDLYVEHNLLKLHVSFSLHDDGHHSASHVLGRCFL